MLTCLTVKDFALFSSAQFSPEEGFVALTGQTGAGKSLVVDALAFVTGSRKGKEFIRNDAEKCEVTALFCPVSEEKRRALFALGIETEADGVEFYRSLSRDARALCRINGRPTTLSVLREAARLFCDIHEQEDAHALLDSHRHLFYLDAFAKDELADARQEYQARFQEYTALKERFQSLYSADRGEEKSRREFLEYQIKELSRAKVREGEYEELLLQKEKLQNAKLLFDTFSAVRAALDAEDGAYDRMMAASAALSKSAHVVPSWQAQAARIEELAAELQDVTRAVLQEQEQTDNVDAALDAIEQRLSLLRRLFGLYAPTEQELLVTLEEKKKSLEQMDFEKEEARRLHAEALAARQRAAEVALVLRARRMEAARQMERQIIAELAELDLSGVRFEVRFFEREKISQSGLDDVQFYIGTNVGQAMMPLSAIASGGELSRILLALRCVLSRLDGIDTLVFDEIDTGVSGKSAAKIGRAMRKLAGERQVLAVTHSAQVAGAAHAQIKVQKQVENRQTVATIHPLNREERIEEIARILSGETLTQTSLASARELLDFH